MTREMTERQSCVKLEARECKTGRIRKRLEIDENGGRLYLFSYSG